MKKIFAVNGSPGNNGNTANAGEPEWLTNNITAEECRRCGQIAPEKCRNNS